MKAQPMNALHSIEGVTTPTCVLLGASALLWLGACGSSNPAITPQLVEARRVVNQAQASRTAALVPKQMDAAWHAFMVAERAHEEDPGSYREAHLAYVAQRKAEAANVSAKTVMALRTEHALDMRYQAKLAGQADGAQAEQDVEEEAQVDDDEAAAALEALGDVANVEQNANTVVITLSSAVLFPTAGDTLSEGARKSLDRVAQAIDAQPEGSKIRVDGYTDSRGAETYNEALSQRRAQSVSDYLAQRGVDSSKLSAEGRGESDPIASNDTDDGRASNRRAEIVIELAQKQGQAQGQAQPTDKSSASGGNMSKNPATSSSSAKSTSEPEKSETDSESDSDSDGKLLTDPLPPPEPKSAPAP